MHRVHAVAFDDGEVVASAGDPALVTLHALVGEAVPGASARAGARRPRRRATSRSPRRPTSATRRSSTPCSALLDKAQATEDDLECGPRRAARRSGSTTTAPASTPGCSPLCRAHGWPHRGLPARRASACSRRCCAEVAAAAAVDEDGSPTAIDGCGVVTFAPAARADGDDVLAARGERGRRAGHRCDARAPGADLGAAGGTDTDLMHAPRRLDRRRAAPRVSSARPARTASGSRSRSRTAPTAPRWPALAAFLGQLGFDRSASAADAGLQQPKRGRRRARETS